MLHVLMNSTLLLSLKKHVTNVVLEHLDQFYFPWRASGLKKLFL